VTPGITLTPVNSFVTLSTDGQVYENKLVTGQIRVTAKNVIIRNVKLIATDNYYGILSQGTNLTVEHTEITRTSGGRGTPPVLGDGSGGDFYGIGTQNYSARWVYVHNLSDCSRMAAPMMVASNIRATAHFPRAPLHHLTAIAAADRRRSTSTDCKATAVPISR
jgi:hypothetical protein